MPKRTVPKLLDGVGDIGVGIDAMHVAGDPAGRVARERRQAAALAYLGRRFPSGEVAELADILGLEPAAVSRRPGHCACGRELPTTAAGRLGAGYEHGRCWWCSSGGRRPARRETPESCRPAKVYEQVLDPVTPPGAQPYPGAQAVCVHCGRTYRLPASGRLRPHPGWVDKDGVETRLSTDCPGSGQYPAEVAGG